MPKIAICGWSAHGSNRRFTNVLLVMKLSMILLTIGFLSVSAKGLSQNVSFSGKNVPLETVFSSVRQQTGYLFLYTDRLLRSAKPVSVSAENLPLEQFLKEVFKNQPLEYKIEGKSIFIEAKHAVDESSKHAAAPVSITVSGIVTDSHNKPLSGASVYIRYKSESGSITDAEGKYSIQAEQNSELVFSFVGFETQVITVGNKAIINVALKPSVSALVYVVVTGYQTIDKQRIAGAVAKPNMDVLNNRTGTMNVIQRLDGLIPGLTVNNSPSASSSGSTFLIRGLTTKADARNFTNPSPLVVVNGFPVDDMNTINPNDVEDITVLKDASAASIWGARAANGVIVITTKKGGNSKPRIAYDAFVNFQGKPDLDYLPVLSSEQFITAAKEVFDPVAIPWASISRGGVAPHEQILYNQANGLITADQANAQLAQLAQFNNKKQISDLFYRDASLMNHNLSVSGGGDRYSYYGSFSYTDIKNNTPGNKNNAYGFNLRQDVKFNDRFKAYLITDFRNAITKSNQNLSVDPRFLPYVSFKNQDGSNASMPWLYYADPVRKDYEARSLINLDYNPLDELGYGSDKSNILNARATAGFTAKLIQGLKFEGTYSINKAVAKSSSLFSEKSFAVRNEVVNFTAPATTVGGSPVYYLPKTGGRYTLSNLNQQNWTVRNQLTYDHSWNNNQHQLTLIAGQEAQEQFNNNTGTVVRGYNPDLLTYGTIDYATLSRGITNIKNGFAFLSPDYYNESENTSRFSSYYATAAYSLAQKYTLNASWRVDHSNLFGTDKAAQNKPVWSVGAAWQIGKEKFLENVSWLNDLGIRSSYGLTGNAPRPGTAASFDILSTSTYGAYPNGLGLWVQSPANRSLTWETTQTVNLGLDFALFNRRLSGSIDVYNKNTSNLIGTMPLNLLAGYPKLNAANAGSMNNKGIEVSLNSLNISNADFKWNTLFTLGYNKNKITHLNPSFFPVTTGDQKIAQLYLEGYSAYSLFAYQYAGLDNMGDPQIKLSNGTTSKAPNVTKPEDIKYMGTYQPVVSGGLTNAFYYKGFGLSINLIYNMGNVMRRDVNHLYSGRPLSTPYGSFYGNENSEFADRWKQPGDEARTNIPSYIASSSISNGRRNTGYYTNADINVLDASFIKCRDITLSYTLPKSIASKLLANDITFRTQLSNIMLWKANDAGIDPEFQWLEYGTRNLRTNQKTISFAAHITF